MPRNAVSHALVTRYGHAGERYICRDKTRESQHPVPTPPSPARPGPVFKYLRGEVSKQTLLKQRARSRRMHAIGATNMMIRGKS